MTAILSPCGLYRYRLERDCGLPFDGGKVFAYFGINPSTADACVDDATVRKWRGFTIRNGGVRFIVGNAFAYRATRVKDLANDPLEHDEANWLHLKQIIADADVLIPCWGNRSKVPAHKSVAFDVLAQALFASGKPVLHLGLTDSGDPRHVLMLGYDTPLVPWKRADK